MKRRVRDDDNRSDELLAECGRRAAELGLAIGWTSGLRGAKAKAASDRGAYAWKEAAVLRDAASAAALYLERTRTRNPLVVASRSGLVLLEVDGELELLGHFGIALPVTVRVASRRGVHFYLRPPAARPPLKAQVSPEGVVVSSDGYLVGVPALHESGVVYRYLGEPDATIAELDLEMYDRIVELGGEVRDNVRRSLEAGEALVEGLRRDTLFSLGLELAHRGLDEDLVGDLLLEVNRRRCSPPLAEADVRAQAHGALVRARKRPSAEHALRQRALEELAAIPRPAEPERRPPGRPPSKHADAVELLREMLAAGPRPAAEVKAEAERRGVSKRTLARAVSELGVLTETSGDPRGGRGGRIGFWHPSAFWHERGSEGDEIARGAGGSANPEPFPNVGVGQGLVTPESVSREVLARPTSGDLARPLSDAVDFDPYASLTCGHEGDVWLARDGLYRCVSCEPAHFRGEVIAIFRGRR